MTVAGRSENFITHVSREQAIFCRFQRVHVLRLSRKSSFTTTRFQPSVGLYIEKAMCYTMDYDPLLRQQLFPVTVFLLTAEVRPVRFLSVPSQYRLALHTRRPFSIILPTCDSFSFPTRSIVQRTLRLSYAFPLSPRFVFSFTDQIRQLQPLVLVDYHASDISSDSQQLPLLFPVHAELPHCDIPPIGCKCHTSAGNAFSTMSHCSSPVRFPTTPAINPVFFASSQQVSSSPIQLICILIKQNHDADDSGRVSHDWACMLEAFQNLLPLCQWQCKITFFQRKKWNKCRTRS